MLVNAAGIALLNSLIGTPTVTLVMQVSWIAVLILVFSMIVPATPRKMLAVARRRVDGSAGGWVGHLTGVPTWSPIHTFVLFMPNYVLRSSPCCRRVSATGSAAGCARRRNRQLSSGRAARPRRHGRSVAGAASAAGAQRRGQAGAPELLGAGSETEAQAHAAPLRARGAGHRRVELAAHDPRVRLRRHRRRDVLLRDGAAVGARSRVAGARASGRCRPIARSSCCARSVIRSPTRTPAAWCIATSSRPTSTCAGWASTTTS